MIGRAIADAVAAIVGGGGPERTYECTACERTIDDFRPACPACGELVVRVVDP